MNTVPCPHNLTVITFVFFFILLQLYFYIFLSTLELSISVSLHPKLLIITVYFSLQLTVQALGEGIILNMNDSSEKTRKRHPTESMKKEQKLTKRNKLSGKDYNTPLKKPKLVSKLFNGTLLMVAERKNATKRLQPGITEVGVKRENM